jgi:hypothetical protein
MIERQSGHGKTATKPWLTDWSAKATESTPGLIAEVTASIGGWIAEVTVLTGGWIARVIGSTPGWTAGEIESTGGWIVGVIAWTTVSTDEVTAATKEWIGAGIKGTIEIRAGRTEGANPDRIYAVINIGTS